MIRLENVSKRYVVDGQPGDWVLKDVSLLIPSGTSVAVFGEKGSGKSTLLRIIEGSEKPTEGQVEQDGRVLTPRSFAHSLDRTLSGRQNTRFLCRINGVGDNVEKLLHRVASISRLGSDFDREVNSYTPLQRNSLTFALSTVFDSQFYVADEFAFAGPGAFGSPEYADMALTDLRQRTTFIFTAKGAQAREFLQKHCQAAIVLHDTNAVWYEDIEVALAELDRASDSSAVPEFAVPILGRIKGEQNGLSVLAKGLRGAPVKVNRKALERVIRAGESVKIVLLTADDLSERGYRLRDGMEPLLLLAVSGGDPVPYYDLNSQCNSLDD